MKNFVKTIELDGKPALVRCSVQINKLLVEELYYSSNKQVITLKVIHSTLWGFIKGPPALQLTIINKILSEVDLDLLEIIHQRMKAEKDEELRSETADKQIQLVYDAIVSVFRETFDDEVISCFYGIFSQIKYE